jgi:hypothetical protein
LVEPSGVVGLGVKDGVNAVVFEAWEFFFGLEECAFTFDMADDGGMAGEYFFQLGVGQGEEFLGTVAYVEELPQALRT